MQKQNRHLREEDHGVIYRMKKAGKTQPEITQAIGFSQSAVSKELKRNKGKRGYRYKQAHQKATQRKKVKNSRERVIQGEIKEVVEKRLMRKHSPEQISGKLKTHGIQVSHETIYAYIAEDKATSGTLYKQLSSTSGVGSGPLHYYNFLYPGRDRFAAISGIIFSSMLSFIKLVKSRKKALESF
jgi:IS30 family transposase